MSGNPHQRVIAPDQFIPKRAKYLDHNQPKSKRLYAPWDRVEHFDGTHPDVGENLLFDIPREGQTYEELAESMFQGWKNSPGHFANMIGERYFRSGLQFEYDPKLNRLYAAQVFSGVPWEPPVSAKLYNKTWRLKEKEPRYCNACQRINFLKEKYAQRTYVQNDSIFIHFQDIRGAKDLLRRKKDGFAVDILLRSQFPCDGPNQYHGSPLHDGILLKPQYAKRLVKKNPLAEKKEFRGYLGQLPPNLGQVELDIRILQSKRVCRAINPLPLQMEDPYLFHLAKPMDTLSGKLPTDLERRKLEFVIPFEKAKYDYTPADIQPMLDSIRASGETIFGIRIQAYSSVEGPTALNLELQEKRARSMYEAIQTVQPEEIRFRKATAENWKAFEQDLKDGPYAYLLDLPRDSVKRKLEEPELAGALEPILAQHRKAEVILYLEEPKEDALPPHQLPAELRKYLKAKKARFAHITQSRMIEAYYQGELPLDSILAVKIPANKHLMPLLTNQFMLQYSIVQLLDREQFWDKVPRLSRINPKYLPARRYHIYFETLRAFHAIDQPHPKVPQWIDELEQAGTDPGEIRGFRRNYYLANLQYLSKQGKRKQAQAAFDELLTFYGEEAFMPAKALELALFLNSLYEVEWALDVMQPLVDEPGRELSSRFLYVFIQNAAFYPDRFPDEVYVQYLRRAVVGNEAQVCGSLKRYFNQFKRLGVKGFYCEVCEGR